MEREIDQRIGAALAMMRTLKLSIVLKREPEGKAFNSQVNLRPNAQLWF